MIQVEVWRKKRVEERQYETSYKWIVEKAKQGFLYQLFGVFGPKYRKLMYIIWQFIYTTAAILIGYSCYHRCVIYIYILLSVYCQPNINFPTAAYLASFLHLWWWLLLVTMEHRFILMSLASVTTLRKYWKEGPNQKTNYYYYYCSDVITLLLLESY